MNREQCVESLKRVFTLQNIGPEHQAAYAETIMEGCGWMDAYRFEEVTKYLCSNLKTNWRLKPGHFREVYQSMAESKGWYRQDAPSPKSQPILWEHVTPRQARNCLAIIEHYKGPYVTEAFVLKLSEIAAQEPEPMKVHTPQPMTDYQMPALASHEIARIVNQCNAASLPAKNSIRTFILKAGVAG